MRLCLVSQIKSPGKAGKFVRKSLSGKPLRTLIAVHCSWYRNPWEKSFKNEELASLSPLSLFSLWLKRPEIRPLLNRPVCTAQNWPQQRLAVLGKKIVGSFVLKKILENKILKYIHQFLNYAIKFICKVKLQLSWIMIFKNETVYSFFYYIILCELPCLWVGRWWAPILVYLSKIN